MARYRLFDGRPVEANQRRTTMEKAHVCQRSVLSVLSRGAWFAALFLPAGLVCPAANGAPADVLRETGRFPAVAQMANAEPLKKPGTLSVHAEEYPPLSIRTASLPEGIAGEYYEVALEAQGGEPPYRWSVVDGTLPRGMVLTDAGVCSGPLVLPGTYIFTVEAADSGAPPRTATRVFTLEVSDGANSIVASAAAVTVPEGGTASFKVKLAAQPAAPTTVTVARASGDKDIAVQPGPKLVFGAANWDSNQTVTLQAAEDADATNGTAIIRCSGTGLFDKEVTATEEDNDKSGLPPAPPADVAASDGTSSACVMVTWSPAEGPGVSYKVFRDGAPVTRWQQDASFADYGAEACRSVQVCEPEGGWGCQGESCLYETEPTYHSYRVKARNADGESELSTADEGHRACAKSAEVAIRETALPARFAAPDDMLALRLRADDPIAPESVWACAEGEGWTQEGGVWRATEAGDNTDGWVVFTPTTLLTPGEVVLLTAGAHTVSGVEIEPATRLFPVCSPLRPQARSGTVPVSRHAAEDDLGPIPGERASAPYRISPAAVFPRPLTVWVPVAADAWGEPVDIYYFSESPAHRGWYPAECALGWMVPGSRRTVVEQGRAWVVFEVNHSGIVQLAAPPPAVPRGAGTGVVLGVLLALLGAGMYRGRFIAARRA